jgi:hypothetical protein
MANVINFNAPLGLSQVLRDNADLFPCPAFQFILTWKNGRPQSV